MNSNLRQRLRLALLRAFARITRPHFPTSVGQRPPSAPHILIIRPDHLGDLLFTTPALRLLRQRHPDAHITALIGPWGTSVLANNPHVDETITLPFPGFTRQAKPSLWQPYGLLRHWARQLQGRYDLALILRFDHWWGALLAYLAGVPRRIGYALPQVAPFLTHAAPYIAGRHEVEQNLSLMNWEFANQASNLPSHHPLEFHVPEESKNWASARFPQRPIAIHPGSGAAVKLWRAERWADVADALTGEGKERSALVLTGSEGERGLCLEIAGRMKAEAQVMAGQTTLAQLAALYARCRLVLGPDSGPLHLAVAVGTPTVHLYGPVDRTTFGPWGTQERHLALVSAWPCIPCNRLDYSAEMLSHHPCIREIDTQEVLTAARRVLTA